MTNDEFGALVRRLEHHPDLYGRRVADVPQLASPRLRFRRTFYRHANCAFGVAVFNLLLALAPGYSLWPVSVVGGAIAIATMFFAEGRARLMTHQLRRPAALQAALDLAGDTE
jgi:hypothetical protein